MSALVMSDWKELTSNMNVRGLVQKDKIALTDLSEQKLSLRNSPRMKSLKMLIKTKNKLALPLLLKTEKLMIDATHSIYLINS